MPALTTEARDAAESVSRRAQAAEQNRHHLRQLDGRSFGPRPVAASIAPHAKKWLNRQTLRQRAALAAVQATPERT